jgi:F-type H+-transporting ATPase subunit b
MLIDWFTVCAQAINFLILVWLLKRFLYQPVLDAIDAREKRIGDELAGANAKKTEAQGERDDFQKKNQAFDEQRGALLTKAADDAKAEGEHLMGDARKAAEGFRAAQENALRSDRTRLTKEITRLTTDEVFAITRKTLADLATVSLEERMGEVFTRHLREMNGAAKAALGEALKTSSEPAQVTSTFDLPPEQRAAIRNALNETFSADIHVQFETSLETVCGIELTSSGQKISWSIAGYLASLDLKMTEVMNAVPAAT